MLNKTIKTGILALSAIFLLSAYSQASPMIGHKVKLDYGTYHKDYFNGGEFLMESTGSTASDYAFTTFCLEKDEFFSRGSIYTIDSITDYAHNNTPSYSDKKDKISNATKWLMNEYSFYYKNLAMEFNVDTNSEAKLFSKAVQKAIWFFEDEPDETGNYLTKYVMDKRGYTKDYDSSFLSNIKVVNLVTTDDQGNIIGYYNQSQLIANPVPEPATMLLFGSGLVGLAAIGRRKIWK